MKILFIAPLPPPLNGQTLQTKLFYEHILKTNNVVLVNTVKSSNVDGIDSFKRFCEVFSFLVKIIFNVRKVEKIYLQISESLAGNLRDLIIFIICFRKLQKTYIHLHGGSINYWVYSKSRILFSLNKIFLKRTAGIIVLGESHLSIYNGFIDSYKLHVVNNFAQDCFFVKRNLIEKKFTNLTTIRVLYLSNMMPEKGYLLLLKGFLSLPLNSRKLFELHFAGKFSDLNDEVNFINTIRFHNNIFYHGLVDGKKKIDLLEISHVLCFPSMLCEGQGICLIEGYASGCVGMTTGLCGISDIFKSNINGFLIDKIDPDSIAKTFLKILDNQNSLLGIALNNNNNAKKIYSLEKHLKSLDNIIFNH